MNTAFLEFLARLEPALYDFVFPMGPWRQVGAHRLDHVALNPQPLPPAARIARSASEVATQIANAAVSAQAQKERGVLILKNTVDDWCGTVVPFPWPKGWPRLDVAEPEPDPWMVDLMFAAASVTFARYAAGLEDGALRDGFRQAAAATAERVGRANAAR